MTKLYNGFNGELDFGDGQDDCKGKGKNDDKSRKKNTQDGFVVVPAKSVDTATAIIKAVQIEYKKNMEELDLENDYKKIENEILKNETWCDAFTKMWDFVDKPGFDEKRLQQSMDKHYVK